MFLQRPDNHTLRQMTFGVRLGIEPVVHHEIQRGRKVGHITAKSVIGIYGNLQPVQVQSIVRLKELLNVRIFIALHLPRGKTTLIEPLESCITLGIHHV